ncbi:MAG: hypothetical protein Q8K63_09755, partial [Acidimicrobiales bacterium]|nr:hypothetical protein [Acidimicrobiales bacterium]
GRARNELTTWTKVDPAETALAAGENRPVTVTIVVPEDASEGERYAVVWAAVSAAAPTGGGIGAVNRVGIRIYLSVGPGGEPASDFEITSITARRVDGRPEVTARVENTGGRALDLAGTLQLTDGPGALRAGPFNAELGTTLGVGDSQSVRVQLDKALPDGPWKASLTLKSGLTERSASATITFPKAGSKTVATDDAGGASPFVAIGAAAGALGLGALLLLFFKRRNRRAPEDD